MPLRDEPKRVVPPRVSNQRRGEERGRGTEEGLSGRLKAPALAWSGSTSQHAACNHLCPSLQPTLGGGKAVGRKYQLGLLACPSAPPWTGLSTWEDPLETGSSQEILIQEDQLGDEDSPPHAREAES